MFHEHFVSSKGSANLFHLVVAFRKQVQVMGKKKGDPKGLQAKNGSYSILFYEVGNYSQQKRLFLLLLRHVGNVYLVLKMV